MSKTLYTAHLLNGIMWLFIIATFFRVASVGIEAVALFIPAVLVGGLGLVFYRRSSRDAEQDAGHQDLTREESKTP